MDNFLLQGVVTELESLLVGHRTGRIFQFGATDLLIDFHQRDGRLLHISTDPARLTLHLTARSHRQMNDEARNDTSFVSLLRKYLADTRLIKLEKIGYDRVVHFEFELETGDETVTRRNLVVALTGRGANCLLIEGSQIIASLREREGAQLTYTDPSPPADKLDPFHCTAEQLDVEITAAEGDISAAAQGCLIGFSAVYARELATRAGHSSPHQALVELLSMIFEEPPSPCLYGSPDIERIHREPGIDELILIPSMIELKSLAGMNVQPFSTVNEAVDRYITLLDERRRFLNLRQKAVSQVTAKIKKQKTLLANLRRELAGFSSAETHQRYGELLLANLHQAEKTGDSFSVIDFYDATQSSIQIPSAGKPTPKDAAEHYFRLARKSRHGQEVIEARLPQVEAELASLTRQQSRLSVTTGFEELNELTGSSGLESRRETTKSGQKTTGKSKTGKISGVRRYKSTDGYEILVGRTDRDNDNLTMRIAKSYDIWFHAADYPGSHVVLRNPQRKEVPARAIAEAAQLAAKFSQAKGGPKVAVNYCEKKFVTKPKGFAPGQVRLSSFKTILVEPAEAGERI